MFRGASARRTRRAAHAALWWLAASILALSVLAVLAFVVMTVRGRLPFWGEAEVVFEASRIRQHYPLFVDPLRGALEYGAPPSRYYVTYPPLVSAALALVPASAALVVGRVLACFAWFGSLVWIATTSARACRSTAIAGAAYVAGVWILVNFAMTARPDSFACAFAAVGLTRAIRDKRVDALSAVLLALAPWIKPTLLGLPVGALLADAVLRRNPRMLVVASVVCTAVGLALYVASDGLVFEHVIRSNVQPFTLAGWLERILHHLPFFASLFIVAVWHGVLGRRDVGTAIGLAATTAAILWTVVAIGKTGSSANYWMEPCIAAVALVAHAPGPYAFGRSGFAHAALTIAALVYTDLASIRSSVERIAIHRHEAEVVASLRSRCGASPDDVIASDEQGIELAANGRIVTTAYQLLWRVHAGKYPAPLYEADLTAPNVRCFVIHSGALDAAPAVGQVVETQFEPLFTDGALRVRKRITERPSF